MWLGDIIIKKYFLSEIRDFLKTLISRDVLSANGSVQMILSAEGNNASRTRSVTENVPLFSMTLPFPYFYFSHKRCVMCQQTISNDMVCQKHMV